MALQIDEKVDWFRLIIDLERVGYSHATLAAAIGAPKSTVHGWKQGANPNWECGERLIDFWIQVTGNGRDSVHVVKRHSYLA